MPSNSYARRVAVVVAAAALLSGCQVASSDDVIVADGPELITATKPSPAPLAPPDMTDDGPGSLLEVAALPNISDDITELGATATRVVYRSTSGTDGQPTTVSGVVMVPGGSPPDGGWPLITFGHGTTGVQNNCGPSKYANLLGSAPIVAALVVNGFAVTMSDYQGLGLDGTYHPYLDSRTAGNNLIDAVRAARKFTSTIGERWAAYGVSLGGMAAWAASDRAGTYGQGLQLVGTAAIVPISDMTGLADAAANGTLTREQYPLLMYALEGLSKTHPEMNLDDYRFGLARDRWSTFMQCVGPEADQVPDLVQQLQPSDLRPASREATDQLRGWLAEMALPKQKSISPLLVLYGSDDQLILSGWTEKALDAACKAGDVVEYHLRYGEGHGDLDSTSSVAWVKDRFAGQKPLNTCGSAQ